MENNGKKVIQISLGKFIILVILLIVVLGLGIGIYINALKRSNADSEMQAMNEKENSINEVSSKDENIILDKEWIKDNMKLKYPSKWKLIENHAYAEATTIEIPESNNKANIYITINENTGNRTAKEIIEDATNPDYGVPTETMDEGEKNIAGVKAFYKTQSMSYDDGSNVNSTTIILIKDILMYEFRYTATRNEYNTYYSTFEKILETIEFVENDTSKYQNISFSNEEIKECLQNYLDLVSAIEASPEKFLNELNLLSEDDLYKGKNNVGKDGYIKTNIPYSKYKTEMMKYVTEEVFNERFTFCFKEVDGLLCWIGGGSGSTYIVDSITLNKDNKYTAKVKYAGVDDVFNTMNVEFKVENYNGRCIISDCDY